MFLLQPRSTAVGLLGTAVLAVGLFSEGSAIPVSAVRSHPGEVSLRSVRRRASAELKNVSGMRFEDKSFSFAQEPRPVFVEQLVAGNVDPSFDPAAGANSSIDAIAIQADGKIVVGGGFTTYAGSNRKGIARINSNGTNDETFNPGTGISGINNRIRSLAIQPDGKILLGGSFDTFNGVPRTNLARINSDGSLDTTFVSAAQASNTIAITMQPDGKILIAGDFNSYGGISRNGVARLNSDGSLDTSFNPGSGTGFGSVVYSMALQPDGKIVLCGLFAQYNGINRKGIVRANADGSLDASFDPGSGISAIQGFAPHVAEIELQTDGKIVIGGEFATYNGVSRNGVARANTDGSLDLNFDPGSGFPMGGVRTISIQSNGKMIIGGGFVTYNGIYSPQILRVRSDGSRDPTFSLGSGADNAVMTSAFQSDGKIVIGGFFSTFNGLRRVRVARLFTQVGLTIPFDFDGDIKTDLSIFRPASGEWWFNRGSVGIHRALVFGVSTDVIAPADFSGDGKTDVAFFRPSTGNWFVLRSEDSSFYSFPFGASGDVAVPADFDADGKADPAVFRASTGTWYINKSTGGTDIVGFGAAGDLPVAADYDGDGKADVAIYRPDASGGQWWIRRSSNGSVFATVFGESTDKTVQGDYTGDGKADIAFFRPSNGNWFILRSEDLSFFAFPFGANGDTLFRVTTMAMGRTMPQCFGLRVRLGL